MAINATKRGFTLVIATIFTTVFLALALTLSSLAYKQQILASAASDSQGAFYAADAALECALHADQQNGIFAYADWPTNWDSYINDPSDPKLDGNPLVLSCAYGDSSDRALKISPDDSGAPCYNNDTGDCPNELIVKYRLPISVGVPDSANNGVGTCADVTIYKYSTGPTFIFSQGYNVNCAKLQTAGARLSARGLMAAY